MFVLKVSMMFVSADVAVIVGYGLCHSSIGGLAATVNLYVGEFNPANPRLYLSLIAPGAIKTVYIMPAVFKEPRGLMVIVLPEYATCESPEGIVMGSLMGVSA
jgi:hypothetical protein